MTTAASKVASVAMLFALVASPSTSLAQAGPYQLPDDHFVCYKTKVSKFNDQIKTLTLTRTLADQFGSGDYAIVKERGLCNPADAGEGIVDQNTHLAAYQIKAAPGTAKHAKQTGVRVFNALGDILVDTVKDDRLLVPASKNEDGTPVSPPTPGTHAVDHYKCYKIKVSKNGPAFVPALVTAQDQFEAQPKAYELKKPKLLCNPVDKAGEGITNADGHLLCYQAKPAGGEPKHQKRQGLYVADQLIEHRLDTVKEDLLCVPSLKNPPDEFCGDGVLNQPPFEDCDGDDLACPAQEVCRDDCTCSTCGNGTIDGGEECEIDADCGPSEFCDADCACQATEPLGQRTLSLGSNSGFFSSFVPNNKQGTPTGTLVLDAGIPDGNDEAAVASVGGPFFIATNLSLGNITLCTRIDSCTGTLYCSGGTNVDTRAEIDSLAASEPMCVRNGTNSCPDQPSSVCCSNACEGVGVGSGNGVVRTIGVGVGDSGPGALAMTCVQRSRQAPLGSDCSLQDYSAASPTNEVYTTGVATARVLDHCASNFVSPSTVPQFSKTGENFDCGLWAVENTAGALAFTIPTEEPSSILLGDAANASVYSDD